MIHIPRRLRESHGCSSSPNSSVSCGGDQPDHATRPCRHLHPQPMPLQGPRHLGWRQSQLRIAAHLQCPLRAIPFVDEIMHSDPIIRLFEKAGQDPVRITADHGIAANPLARFESAIRCRARAASAAVPRKSRGQLPDSRRAPEECCACQSRRPDQRQSVAGKPGSQVCRASFQGRLHATGHP
jgi:hypothetical protein